MLSERLKLLREMHGLNQSELAEKLNVSRVNYNRYENGERFPDQSTLVHIADYFNVSLDYLLGRTNEPHTVMIDLQALKKTPLLDFLKRVYLPVLRKRSFDTLGEDCPMVNLIDNFDSLSLEKQIDFLNETVSSVSFDGKKVLITPPIVLNAMDDESIIDRIKRLPLTERKALLVSLINSMTD